MASNVVASVISQGGQKTMEQAPQGKLAHSKSSPLVDTRATYFGDSLEQLNRLPETALT